MSTNLGAGGFANSTDKDSTTKQQTDQTTAEERNDTARETRQAFEEKLSSGEGVHPQDLAVASGLVTIEDKSTFETSGMTLPSVPLEKGVAPDGSVVDKRHDENQRIRKAILEGKPLDDSFPVVSGGNDGPVTVKRLRDASNGVSQEGAPKDGRRVVLVDTAKKDESEVSGATLFTTTVDTTPEKTAHQPDPGIEKAADKGHTLQEEEASRKRSDSSSQETSEDPDGGDLG